VNQEHKDRQVSLDSLGPQDQEEIQVQWVELEPQALVDLQDNLGHQDQWDLRGQLARQVHLDRREIRVGMVSKVSKAPVEHLERLGLLELPASRVLMVSLDLKDPRGQSDSLGHQELRDHWVV
jgi:hypothetical protein